MEVNHFWSTSVKPISFNKFLSDLFLAVKLLVMPMTILFVKHLMKADAVVEILCQQQFKWFKYNQMKGNTDERNLILCASCLNLVQNGNSMI